MNGYTTFQLSAETYRVGTLNKMWFWAEITQLNANELSYKLLLSIDSTGFMVWHRAADKESLQSLDILWSCVKEAELNIDEFLFTQTGKGYTGFILAAECNIVETLNILLVWTEEMQLNPNELNNCLYPKTVMYTWRLTQ